MKAIPASNVSARVEELIEQHDGGDRDTAARRLGIAPDRLVSRTVGEVSRGPVGPWRFDPNSSPTSATCTTR